MVIERYLSIPEIAKMCDTHPSTMRRRLYAMHRMSGGTLMRRIGLRQKKWGLTLAALREVAPELFVTSRPSRFDLENLFAELKDTRKKLNATCARLRFLESQRCQTVPNGAADL